MIEGRILHAIELAVEWQRMRLHPLSEAERTALAEFCTMNPTGTLQAFLVQR